MAKEDRKRNQNALWLQTFPCAKQVDRKWFEIAGKNGRWEKVPEAKAVRQGTKVEDGGGVVYAFVMWEKRVYPFRPEIKGQKELAA